MDLGSAAFTAQAQAAAIAQYAQALGFAQAVQGGGPPPHPHQQGLPNNGMSE